MSTRAIRRKREDGLLGGNWQPQQERAPSVMRPETATLARFIGMAALLPTAVGALSVVVNRFGGRYAVPIGWGYFFLLVGLAGLIYHAFTDKETQYRRLYWIAGLALFLMAAVIRFLPYGAERTVGGLFLSDGAPCAAVGLCFLIAFLRNETDELLRNTALRIILGLGTLMALTGMIGGVVNETYLMGEGAVMLLLGLLFLTTFITFQDVSSNAGHYVGLGIGVLGGLMIALSVTWLIVPSWVPFIKWSTGQPGSPFLMIYAGLEYLILCVGVCSDSKLVVLTRRELAAFFYSPVAHIVLICSAVLGWWSFNQFANELWDSGNVPEPIIITFFLNLVSFFSIIVMVPVMTMRLVSEEKRSGTLEVLLTAPVNETTVILSKFLASLRFFLLCWYPWCIYLIALRVEGGEPYQYRPLLLFAIALVVTGASFMSMGVFFSSLTRSQLAAAMLTFVGMMVYLGIFFLRRGSGLGANSPWMNILQYVSFIDLWISSLFGTFQPRFLVFYVSATIFWLFLSVKVLEARKWS